MTPPFWRSTAILALAAVAGVATALTARHTVATPHVADHGTTAHITAHDAHDRFAAGHLENAIRLAPDDREEIHLGGSDATVQFHVKNQFPGPATIRYATELTDELGNEMVAPATSEPVEMEAGAETSFDVEIPSRVRRGSGFYLLRITAVGRSGEDVSDETLEIGLATVGGSAFVLDAEQWLEFSLANLGEAR